MKCPVCKDVTLLMTEKKGIEIDYCPECRGIWLDRGELEKLTEKAMALATKVYENIQKEEAAKANNDSNSDSSNDDDVKEAEYEEK